MPPCDVAAPDSFDELQRQRFSRSSRFLLPFNPRILLPFESSRPLGMFRIDLGMLVVFVWSFVRYVADLSVFSTFAETHTFLHSGSTLYINSYVSMQPSWFLVALYRLPVRPPEMNGVAARARHATSPDLSGVMTLVG
jgi:hypothetical protein